MKHSTTRLKEAASVRAGLPIIILLIVLVIGLSACTFRKGEDTSDTQHKSFDSIMNAPFTSNRDQESGLLEELISCVESQDQSELAKYFAPQLTASDTFEQQCADLFDFYNGTMESNEWMGGITERSKKPGCKRINRKISYDVYTTDATYRFAILFCTMDTQDEGNIGIQSLYIIRFEDTDPQYSYWGDGNWTLGINVMTEPQA